MQQSLPLNVLMFNVHLERPPELVALAIRKIWRLITPIAQCLMIYFSTPFLNRRPLLEAAAKALLQLLSDLLLYLSSRRSDCHNILAASVSLVLYSHHVFAVAVGYRSATHEFNEVLKTVCNKITRWVKKEFRSPFEIQSQDISGGTRLQEMRVDTI